VRQKATFLHFIHTKDFDLSIADIAMTDEDLRAVQETLQADPEAGDPIPKTGGVRKVRAALKRKAKGKVGARAYSTTLLFAVRRSTCCSLTTRARQTTLVSKARRRFG